MRHEQIADRASYDRIEIAAVWPVTTQLVPPAAPDMASAADEVFVPTAAAPDVPAAAAGLLVASYAALIAAFALVTVASAQSIFAIVVCALFVVAFFAVPRIFLAVEPKQGRRVSFAEFMRGGMETLTGHSTGPAALVQMLIVPVTLTVGVLVIGIAKAWLI